ncbi:hypothetical protein M0812_14854 [Anaeramoeba flamelloides]|uniref:Uncharacterized protein n=1 Tax=Anaeramoeba flamelloides TaxID=1746091 RepID=A0AAV7ZAE4_9EUKA|nr:hypothetical protein M0812_14854 [Anaeramoeba flamelloides]
MIKIQPIVIMVQINKNQTKEIEQTKKILKPNKKIIIFKTKKNLLQKIISETNEYYKPTKYLKRKKFQKNENVINSFNTRFSSRKEYRLSENLKALYKKIHENDKKWQIKNKISQKKIAENIEKKSKFFFNNNQFLNMFSESTLKRISQTTFFNENLISSYNFDKIPEEEIQNQEKNLNIQEKKYKKTIIQLKKKKQKISLPKFLTKKRKTGI